MYQQIIELSPTETLRLNWERNYTFFTVYLNGQIIVLKSEPSPGQKRRRWMAMDH